MLIFVYAKTTSSTFSFTPLRRGFLVYNQEDVIIYSIAFGSHIKKKKEVLYLRIIEYRQQLDAYLIAFSRLYLPDIDIIFNNSEWNDLDGFQKLARMAIIDTEQTQIEFHNEEYEPLFSAAEIGEDFKGLRFGAIDIKIGCLGFGFYIPSDADPITPHDERKFIWFKIPLTYSSGTILVKTMDSKNDERYQIKWEKGYVTNFSENINGNLRDYTSINSSPTYGSIGNFTVKECTPC